MEISYIRYGINDRIYGINLPWLNLDAKLTLILGQSIGKFFFNFFHRSLNSQRYKMTVICSFSISVFGQVEAEAVARLQAQDEDMEDIFDLTHLSISM